MTKPKFKTLLQILKERSFKQTRHINKKKRHAKYLRKVTRKFQSRNNGKHPDIKNIPMGDYCMAYINHIATPCKYYSRLKYKEALVLYGEERVSWAEGDMHIGKDCGACSLLNENDYLNGPDDMFSLLWDGVKSCPFNLDR